MAKKESDKVRLDRYMRRIDAAENWRDKTYRERWERWYKMWRNHVDQIRDRNGKVVTDRSNISVPYPFIMLETILPRLVETLFAGRPYVTVKGVPTSLSQMRQHVFGPDGAPIPQDQSVRPWVSAAEKMQTLLDYQQNVVFDIQDVFHTGLKIMGLYGTTVAYTGWKLKERNVIRKELQQVMDVDPSTGEEVPMLDDDGVTPIQDWQEVDVSVKEYDDPELKFLDLGLFFVDPNADDIENARYCGHVEYMSKDELKAMADSDPDMKLEWKKIPRNQAQNEARSYRMGAVGIPTDGDLTLADHEDDSLYEVHRYWEDDRCVIIINRQYLAKDAPNPFYHKKKPYDRDVYSEDPGNFYGIGIMQMVEDSHAELNTERNQRIDYRSHSLRRMFKVNKNADIDRGQLVWKQNGVIEVEDGNDVTTFDAPDGAVGSSFTQENIIKEEMKEVTGAHDIVMGTAGGGETATTTMTKDNNASIRFKMIISSVEKRLLVGISRKMIQLNQQFIDDIRLLPLFDKDEAEWPVISPEDIQGEFHLTAAGSSVEPIANKEAFKQRMVELYGVLSGDPFMQQFPIKRRNLLKKLLESFDLQDTEDLLPSDEEVNGIMEQQFVERFMAGLPPQLQQLIGAFMQGGAPAPAQAMPPSDGSGGGNWGGGANTAMMQEQGLPMLGGGV